MIAGWIASGDLNIFIICLTVLEVVGIAGLRQAGWGRLSVRQVLPNVLAGDFLLLAWLCDVKGAWWGVIAGCLLGALVGHGVDLTMRWREG